MNDVFWIDEYVAEDLAYGKRRSIGQKSDRIVLFGILNFGRIRKVKTHSWIKP